VAGERGRLEVARPRGHERPFVVLGTPGGERAGLPHLSAQDAVDAAGHCGGGPGAADGVDEGVGRTTSSDVAQDGEHVDHRVVVVGDARVVTLAQRKELRPATVGILGGEQVVDAPREGLAVSDLASRMRHKRQELHRERRGVVVEAVCTAASRRRDVFGRARRNRQIRTLGPAALERLILEDAVGKGARLDGAIPLWLLPEDGHVPTQLPFDVLAGRQIGTGRYGLPG